MSPRPSLTESRRQDILAAASAAIAERGLCETRIADIADNIGASPALILYYFPSKAALLTEALVYQDRLFAESVKEALEGGHHRSGEVLHPHRGQLSSAITERGGDRRLDAVARGMGDVET